MAQVTFRRGDGVEFSVDDSSAAFALMSKDGSFVEIDGLGGELIVAADADDKPVDLAKLSKKQLFEEAAIRDIPVTDKMTKDQIIEAINAGEEETVAE